MIVHVFLLTHLKIDFDHIFFDACLKHGGGGNTGGTYLDICTIKQDKT